MIIKLTDINGMPILINTNSLHYARKVLVNNIYRTILYLGDDSVDVSEAPEEIYAMIQPPIKPTAHFQYEIELTDKGTNLPIFLDASSIKCIKPGVGINKEVSTYVEMNGGQVYKVVESSSEVKRIRDEALDKLKNRLVPPIKSNNRTTFIYP